MPCIMCGSFSINHHAHGRDGSDAGLCDVCFWHKRAGGYADIVSAAKNLIAQKGRHNTEIAYKRLQDAVEAAMYGNWLKAKDEPGKRRPHDVEVTSL